MKKDFFIQLAKKDEKMTLLKIGIAAVLCFIIHIMMLVNLKSFLLYTGIDGKGSILTLMYDTVDYLVYLVFFLLENILIIIYLKFKVNGEIDKFFKLNYILLILSMGFFSVNTMIAIFFITNIYKCFEFAKTFSKNKKNFLLSLLGFFIIFFNHKLLYELDNFYLKIIFLLQGILVVSIIYLYSKKINKSI